MVNQPICIAFMKIIALTQYLGVMNIKSLGKPWVHAVDERWTIAINGQPVAMAVEIDQTMGVAALEPYHAAVWYNGWLAGIFSPAGGVFAAGSGANEETFAAAIDAAIKTKKGQ